MIKNKRPKISNGVFKTVVKQVVKEELKSTQIRLEKRLGEKLEGRIQKTEVWFEQRLKETERNLEERLEEKIQNLPTKDEFFTTMDKVMGELQTMRGEFTVHQGQHSEINERFEKLESTLPSS